MEYKYKNGSEYLAEKFYAKAIANERHNLIVGNLFAELHGQLRKRPCKVYNSEMRVKVSTTGLYAHPDVLVVYGDAVFEDSHRDTLLNPTVIVEVLSDSTEENDRVHKFEHYHEIESLKEYLLVSQNEYHVEHYVRLPDNYWYLYEYNNYHEHFHMEAIMANLAMSEIYFKVDVPH